MSTLQRQNECPSRRCEGMLALTRLQASRHGRALDARLPFPRLVVHRRAQNDPAIDRHDLELKRKTIAVAVEPGCSDLGPKGFVVAFADVPGDEVG